jgi:hypothetical protein
VALAAEPAREELGEPPVVFDEEDAHASMLAGLDGCREVLTVL